MRAVSFVERLEFDSSGNIYKNAMCLGDVDNDAGNELVVGNMQGDLSVFKGRTRKPWALVQDLGLLTAVIVGDVLNVGRNFLLCINGEGWSHIFEAKRDAFLDEDKKRLHLFHTQRLPACTKMALLADIDGDGHLELVLGLTDRVLRTYRWVQLPQTEPEEYKGKLVGIHKWEFANQIGSISLNPTSEGKTCILVSQPGGTYARLDCNRDPQDDEGDWSSGSAALVSKLTPEHHLLTSSHMRNPNISSEIIGGISGTRDGLPTSSLLAMATLDGTLMFVDGDAIIWSLQVDHQLFALTKLDLIGDGKEEVIACAWDGHTYIVNQERQSLRFQFEEPVCTFTSGQYSLGVGETVPCLVYATFSDRVYLYYNVRIPAIRTSNLFEVVEEDTEAVSLIGKLPEASNVQELRELFRWCLYGSPTLLKDNDDVDRDCKEESE